MGDFTARVGFVLLLIGVAFTSLLPSPYLGSVTIVAGALLVHLSEVD